MATKYWSGTKTWNAINTNWGTSAGGPFTVAKFNAGDDGVFVAAGGTVSVSSPANPNSMTFNGTYTLNNSTVTLQGAGSIVVAAGLITTINSAIAGAVGLTKTGDGTAILNGVNTYTGPTSVAGTVVVKTLADGGSNSSIGVGTADATSLILNGGILSFQGTSSQTSNRNFTVTALGAKIMASGDTTNTMQLGSDGTAIAFTGVGDRVLTLGGTNGGSNIIRGIIGYNSCLISHDGTSSDWTTTISAPAALSGSLQVDKVKNMIWMC